MNHRDAYRIACLGVTEEDWRLLALEAFEVSYFSHNTMMWNKGCSYEMERKVK